MANVKKLKNGMVKIALNKKDKDILRAGAMEDYKTYKCLKAMMDIYYNDMDMYDIREVELNQKSYFFDYENHIFYDRFSYSKGNDINTFVLHSRFGIEEQLIECLITNQSGSVYLEPVSISKNEELFSLLEEKNKSEKEEYEMHWAIRQEEEEIEKERNRLF